MTKKSIKENRKNLKIVNKINNFRPEMEKLSEAELKEKHLELKTKAQNGEDLFKLLPEAFALIRETTKRALNKEPYDVQLLAGITLFQGKIAEAKTGEGKSIAIYAPAYLESLLGKGVHVVTVNDYLAKRDAGEAKKVFDLLGVSVGCILHDHTLQERKVAYACDITYATNSELGFDYLKDHLTFSLDDVVLRNFQYAIIDEVDSILIDECKTPLIISGPQQDISGLLLPIDAAIKQLEEGELDEASKLQILAGKHTKESGDYVKIEKENIIFLTDQGSEKMEQMLHIDQLTDPSNIFVFRAVNNALRANFLMDCEKDYIVKDDKVEIVDPYTGRVLPGRRFSNGLHQAIEAKERVTIQPETITVASVTYQSFFNRYKKLSGLSGTAVSANDEFQKVYNLDVIEIPTNKPIIRIDKEDKVYRTEEEKWRAVLDEAIEIHKTGQPILIGTKNIDDSERISKMLTEYHIEHQVLNAKNEALEAEIISHAGELSHVTVATNMAGRGTDISLDPEAKAAGGLYVIGTQRNESRRIDDQLKGRSGRQGDPGASQFFLSLEDEIMQVFGDSDALESLTAMSGSGALSLGIVSKFIEKAQKAVEDRNYSARDSMLKYDEADTCHREELYKERDEILAMPSVHEYLRGIFYECSDEIVDTHIPDENTPPEQWDVDTLMYAYFEQFSNINIQLDVTGMNREDMKEALHKVDDIFMELKQQEIPDPVIFASVEKNVLLRMIDRNWADFLATMEMYKQGIGNVTYGQKDPVVEYRLKGLSVFNQMVKAAKRETVMQFLNCSVAVQ